MPRVVGMAYALPSRRVTNEDLAADLGTTAAEIERSLGVRERRYAEAGEGPSDLAARAAAGALEEAGWTAADVEFLVFATMTPDVTFPGAGCYLQTKLGCGTVGALDLRAQCAGLPFAIDVADAFLRAGRYRRILVALGEVHSSGLERAPRGADVTPLFGDGAAALALDAEGDGILATELRTDATELERFWCEFPSSRRLPTRFLEEDFAAGRYYPAIDREAVGRSAREKIPEVVTTALSAAGLSADQVKRYFLQHVHRDAASAAADALGVAARADVGDPDLGHVASASLAISLCRARDRGDVGKGDVVCLATSGAGQNSAATILRL